jgi:hypothetical protein
MAVGVTDPMWLLRKLLRSRVPPWSQLQTVSVTVPGKARGVERLRDAQRQAMQAG